MGKPTHPLDESDSSAPVETTPSPQLARSLQATAAVWRQVKAEFGLLTSSEVAAILGTDPSNGKYVSSKQAANEIVGVLRGRGYLFPGFQFDRDRGTVLPVIARLIELAHANQWDEESLILWMQSPSTSFEDEARPVDHLRDDPDAVLAAARTAFEAVW
ncbi:hypothetical protein [Cryobacterium tagatosivorans]|uniref:Uncharacterized protein n=1 Tax=Cryobacterium tagatosivorans TaxID=1259199 RepID=A0A4R8UAU9_9MICO|nr:hypothetical protein [Cryobacterium tagatosivorans]TFB47270.1 hypothetical protein E3O23_15550 [Cryobacterium tagatosivorans]